MAIFKGKTGIEGKRELVFHGGKVIATIIGTFETEDAQVIDALTTLGYERLDAPQVEPKAPEVPVVEPKAPEIPPEVPAKTKKEKAKK